MPLLMCPNDNASMQTLQRNGVEFDMCPTCRGVWLDRGELDKLIERAAPAAAPPGGTPRAARPGPVRPPARRGRPDRHGIPMPAAAAAPTNPPIRVA